MKAAILVALASACSSGNGGSDQGADASVTPGSDAALIDSAGNPPVDDLDFESIIAARPYTMHVPANAPSGPLPLVVFLHGYGWGGGVEEATLIGLPADSDRAGYLLAMPDGTPDLIGQKFWNATDACCSMFAAQPAPDDVKYLRALILHARAHNNVDPKRVYMTGHSNGAFMTHRYACDRGADLAAIAPLAGMMWSDPAKCAGSTHVSVVQTHANTDELIQFGGGTVPLGSAPFPSAMATVTTWAQKNGCTGALAAGGTALDVDTAIAGAETTRQAFGGCPSDGDVELWTITGGQHDPDHFGPVWTAAIWTFFDAHRRP